MSDAVQPTPYTVQLTPYRNISLSVQLLFESVMYLSARDPASLDRVTTHEHSLHTQPARNHYLDQLFDWMKLLFNKRESLTEAEQRAHQREFARILDVCHVALAVLSTRLNQ